MRTLPPEAPPSFLGVRPHLRARIQPLGCPVAAQTLLLPAPAPLPSTGALGKLSAWMMETRRGAFLQQEGPVGKNIFLVSSLSEHLSA